MYSEIPGMKYRLRLPSSVARWFLARARGGQGARGLALQEQPPGGEPPSNQPPRRPNQGPPDLDEIWNDLSRRLNRLFGGKGQRNTGGGNRNRLPNLPQPGMKGAGIGLVVVILLAFLFWLGSGIFIVKEGQQAVITQFGRYHSKVGAGMNWRLPWPFQRAEIVNVTQIRSLDVGGDGLVQNTGLHESAMLTADENIVEIKFSVQYRLSDAPAFVFNTANPQDAVTRAAESAVREVVGQMTMDNAMADERDQIAPRVRKLMQSILDRYQVGIEVVAVNLQQSGVSPPEQVKAAFDDVLTAGQERVRAQNVAQAYANSVVPRANGVAARLKQEAEGYKASVVARAQGDAQRFSAVLAQYEKAPQVTRDRLYVDTMREVYTNATKVLVDGRAAGNLIYLPLDKILQAAGAKAGAAPGGVAASAQPTPAPSGTAVPTPAPIAGDNNGSTSDARSRDDMRSREREAR
jgi:membrane protease subunit HflK